LWTKPIDSNKTAKGKHNRRVEILIKNNFFYNFY
jgi:flagellar motor protein MotB